MEARAIDWEAVHRRLAAAASALDAGFDRDPETTRRVLESRARAAAKPPEGPVIEDRIEILAFSLANELYAVETRHVLEVRKLRELTALPCTPPFIAGAMSLHGRILAIVDLCRFFELPVKGLTELDWIIVLRGGTDELGLLADSVDGIRTVAVSDFLGRPSAFAGIRGKFITGVTSRMLALLDGDRLLRDADLKVDDTPRGGFHGRGRGANTNDR